MDLALMPSLELIAIAKLTIILWKKHSRIYYNYFSRLSEFWNLVEREVKDIIGMINLPKSLKLTVIKFYKTVSMEMLIWVQFHLKFISIQDILPICCHCIKWTLVGTIDKKSTAETFVKNLDLCVKSRYMLACYYCLESSIPLLYENLSEINDSNDSDWNDSAEPSDVVIKFWTHRMRKNDACYCFNCSNVFEHAAIRGNKIASEYFFQHLHTDALKHSLVNTALKVVRERRRSTRFCYPGREYYSEVLFFFITQMNTEQLQQLLQSHDDLGDILACFLEWPMHVYFMDMVNLSWEYFERTNYPELLCRIIHRDKFGYEDYNYRKLFKEFWEQSPDICKTYLVDDDFEIYHYLKAINDEMNRNILLDYSPS